MSQNKEAPESLRLDKWLWAARFYKTRSLAVDALKGGKVHVNGERAKPSKIISIGDVIRLRKAPYEYSLEVLAINAQRRPANEARSLYKESDESIEKRQHLQTQIQMSAVYTPQTAQRPDKRQRRSLVKMKGH